MAECVWEIAVAALAPVLSIMILWVILYIFEVPGKYTSFKSILNRQKRPKTFLVCFGKRRERSYSNGSIMDKDGEQQEEEVVIKINFNLFKYWNIIYYV